MSSTSNSPPESFGASATKPREPIGATSTASIRASARAASSGRVRRRGSNGRSRFSTNVRPTRNLPMSASETPIFAVATYSS
jgi:hypothetical protein